MGGRSKREETDVYRWLIRVDVWWKPTQYCKAIILQLKINKFFKKWVRGERSENSFCLPSSVCTTESYCQGDGKPHNATWSQRPALMMWALQTASRSNELLLDCVKQAHTHTHTHTSTHTELLFRFKRKNDTILIWTKYWKTYFWLENSCLIL